MEVPAVLLVGDISDKPIHLRAVLFAELDSFVQSFFIPACEQEPGFASGVFDCEFFTQAAAGARDEDNALV